MIVTSMLLEFTIKKIGGNVLFVFRSLKFVSLEFFDVHCLGALGCVLYVELDTVAFLQQGSLGELAFVYEYIFSVLNLYEAERFDVVVPFYGSFHVFHLLRSCGSAFFLIRKKNVVALSLVSQTPLVVYYFFALIMGEQSHLVY